jgi:hypothetical protein
MLHFIIPFQALMVFARIVQDAASLDCRSQLGLLYAKAWEGKNEQGYRAG